MCHEVSQICENIYYTVDIKQEALCGCVLSQAQINMETDSSFRTGPSISFSGRSHYEMNPG